MVDSVANRPAPTANGTFARTPLIHLLLYVLDKKLSGTLELQTPDRRTATLQFVAGQPAKIRTSEPVEYLGRVLSELRLITEEQLTRSLADLAKQKASGRRLHGEVLLALGALDEAKLQQGLHEQLARKLRHCAGMPPETAYAYFDGFDALAAWGGPATAGIDPYGVLWSMLREYPPWEHVHAALAKLGASPMRLHGGDLPRLGLAPDELTVVELLRSRPLPAPDLARAGQLNERTGQLLAYLLLITHQVDVLAADAPPPSRPAVIAQRLARPPTPLAAHTPTGTPATRTSPPAGRSQPPSPHTAAPKASTAPPAQRASGRPSLLPVPPGLSGPLSERWKEITDRAATIDRADYFSMLDIARDATTEQVEAAYFALAKVWHPDRLPADLAPVREPCARVFSRMSEARASLADPKQRERYMKLVAEGSGSPETQETVARVVDASTQFQKAEVCLKRNDPVQAEEFCRRAVELDDTQPDYLAMLAWLIASKPEHQSGDKTMQCVRMLDKAVAMGNRSEKAYFYRGLLYKRLGKVDLAVRDFRKAMELNPRNIDAAREVRLHTMRGGTGGKGSVPPPAPGKESSPPPGKPEDKPGLLGRFFKK